MIARSLDVVVVGAANVDLVVQVPRLPLAGETVFGAPLTVLPGGKGLNQAVAVARNGGNAALVSRIGTDGWGDLLHEALVGAGVGTAAVARRPGSATGAAIVLMPPDGDSALVLSRAPGGLPTTADIDAATRLLSMAPVTVVQLELPVDVVERTVALAGGRVIGTLAPLSALPHEVLVRLDAIVVNATEAAAMLNMPSSEVGRSPIAAARALTTLGPTNALVTLGSAGAVFAAGEDSGAVSATSVPVTDTAGAGDAALGVFALAVARGRPFRQAVVAAVEAGTAAVQQYGAMLGPPASAGSE